MHKRLMIRSVTLLLSAIIFQACAPSVGMVGVGGMPMGMGGMGMMGMPMGGFAYGGSWGHSSTNVAVVNNHTTDVNSYNNHSTDVNAYNNHTNNAFASNHGGGFYHPSR
jgi:hypothetical protein